MSKATNYIKYAQKKEPMVEPWYSIYHPAHSLHFRLVTNPDELLFNPKNEKEEEDYVLRVKNSHQFAEMKFYLTNTEAYELGKWLVETFGSNNGKV